MDSHSVWWIIVALGLGAIVGALWTRVRTQSQLITAQAQCDTLKERLDTLLADRKAVVNEFKVLADESLVAQQARADQQAAERLEHTQTLLDPVRDGLNALNQQITKMAAERAAMTAQLREQVGMVLTTSTELRNETNALSTALRKPQVRGAWGEMQLRRVVEIAGMVEHCSFVEQASSVTAADTRVRPDMTVLLGDGKCIHVDSKVPLAAFLDAQHTDDPGLQAQHMARFAENVKAHIDALSAKKYWTTNTSSPEFVVLFIPSETLGAEALAHFPELHEYAAQRNIVVATPTTLIGLLRAVAYGWRQSALAESAAEVFALGRELYERLTTLGANLGKLGRSLHASVNAYNATIGTVEHRVMVTARRFRDLKVTEAELAPMSGVDQLPRGLSAPELIDAEQQESIIGVSKSPTHSVTVSSPNSGDKLPALSSEEPLNRPVHRRTSHSGRSGPTR